MASAQESQSFSGHNVGAAEGNGAGGFANRFPAAPWPKHHLNHVEKTYTKDALKGYYCATPYNQLPDLSEYGITVQILQEGVYVSLDICFVLIMLLSSKIWANVTRTHFKSERGERNWLRLQMNLQFLVDKGKTTFEEVRAVQWDKYGRNGDPGASSGCFYTKDRQEYFNKNNEFAKVVPFCESVGPEVVIIIKNLRNL